MTCLIFQKNEVLNYTDVHSKSGHGQRSSTARIYHWQQLVYRSSLQSKRLQKPLSIQETGLGA